MKKMKRSRGFYSYSKHNRELKRDLRRRPLYLEFWLKHLSSPLNDVHFFIRWRTRDELERAYQFMATVNKEGYEDVSWLRFLDSPRTRTEKAIMHSRLSGLKHLHEIV